MRTLVLRIAFAAYLVVVGFVVWSPAPEAFAYSGPLGSLARGVSGVLGAPFETTYDVLEMLANVVMFVPFGAFAMAAFPGMRVWSTTLAGFVTSGIIEGVQLFIPTRYSTVSDLVTNTLGALLGALAVALWRRRARARATGGPVSVQE